MPSRIDQGAFSLSAWGRNVAPVIAMALFAIAAIDRSLQHLMGMGMLLHIVFWANNFC